MILIGIIGLFLVGVLWVLLYSYFLRRTDRFMDNWEREIKEKAEKATHDSIRSLEEAAEAIKASRKEMERFAYDRGFIPKPPSEEVATAEPKIETQLEPIASPSPSFQFAPYKTRKHKEWENLIRPWQPIPYTA